MRSCAAASRQEVAEKHNARQAFLPLVEGLAGRAINIWLPLAISHGEGLSSNCAGMHKLSFLKFTVLSMPVSAEGISRTRISVIVL